MVKICDQKMVSLGRDIDGARVEGVEASGVLG